MFRFFCSILFIVALANVYSQNNLREDILLNDKWRTVADSNRTTYKGFENPEFNDNSWLLVDIPHNWDDYGGYRTEKHGNRHGYAWYRKYFTIHSEKAGKRFFLWFEGVGSYTTVWINGHLAGQHAGGRTSFSLDITEFIKSGQPNLLAVRADHPANIQDLPWVCGGCSPEVGFSEGSQPFGIFRPVHLIVTAPLRIEPFGIYVWNNNDITDKLATLHLTAEIKNYDNKAYKFTLLNIVLNKEGQTVAEVTSECDIAPGKTVNLTQKNLSIAKPHLWRLEDPYLYSIVSEIWIGKKVIDRISTPFGIRWISWSDKNQFLLNGKPVFINGIAEYEHILGQSHAFTDEQIRARVMQITAAGFNAFRDAHQPHNLKYQEYWDKLGILWWPQFAAHIWYDTPSFRTNFKNLLKDWVKERRNSPSIILWGLENESTLPQSFAEECSDIIRELDPTASLQRKITTCNGGKGTDWNVPQNWTGTYGGDPAEYAEDIQKQQLIGEYGAWRCIDLHTDVPFDSTGISSETRMLQLMEMKVRLADSVKEKCYGHFFWLLNSHDNPGRIQNGDGYRNIDRIGPVNYKGLFTSWGEPLDVFYMYRANFADKEKEPMVYIVSHTWPDRWISPGIKNEITVYSNCDEVELFNDIKSQSFGIKKKNGTVGHFQWDSVPVKYNILYAEGKIKGKVVANDLIKLNHLPYAPQFNALLPDIDTTLKPAPEYKYLYRINCGGPEYLDKNGNTWMADETGNAANTWYSKSWADNYPLLPLYFGSQRRTFDPVKGTKDGPLFQTFRYGRHLLKYKFPVPDGDYLIELYFIEPWFGTGGSMDCKGWRLFNIAINDSVVLKSLDIWYEAGHDQVLKKIVKAHIKGGLLNISFPRVFSGQAIISAIAIASKNSDIKPAPAPQSIIKNLVVNHKKNANNWSVQSWLDTGTKQYADDEYTFSSIPRELNGDYWIRTLNNTAPDTLSLASFLLTDSADIYIALNSKLNKPGWLSNWKSTNLRIENDNEGSNSFVLYKKHFSSGYQVILQENGASKDGKADMYTIIVHRPTILEQPVSPARPAITYETENANLKGAKIGNIIGNYSGKGYAILTNSTDTLDWPVKIGVGDNYGLRFKYINSSSKEIVAKMSVITDDGNILYSSNVYFSPTSAREWDKVNITTVTSINAGQYIIRLITSQAEGLIIDNLKVQ
jgi:beta-galactosidase